MVIRDMTLNTQSTDVLYGFRKDMSKVDTELKSYIDLLFREKNHKNYLDREFEPTKMFIDNDSNIGDTFKGSNYIEFLNETKENSRILRDGYSHLSNNIGKIKGYLDILNDYLQEKLTNVNDITTNYKQIIIQNGYQMKRLQVKTTQEFNKYNSDFSGMNSVIHREGDLNKIKNTIIENGYGLKNAQGLENNINGYMNKIDLMKNVITEMENDVSQKLTYLTDLNKINPEHVEIKPEIVEIPVEENRAINEELTNIERELGIENESEEENVPTTQTTNRRRNLSRFNPLNLIGNILKVF